MIRAVVLRKVITPAAVESALRPWRRETEARLARAFWQCQGIARSEVSGRQSKSSARRSTKVSNPSARAQPRPITRKGKSYFTHSSPSGFERLQFQGTYDLDHYVGIVMVCALNWAFWAYRR